jgi:hypothetical protein
VSKVRGPSRGASPGRGTRDIPAAPPCEFGLPCQRAPHGSSKPMGQSDLAHGPFGDFARFTSVQAWFQRRTWHHPNAILRPAGTRLPSLPALVRPLHSHGSRDSSMEVPGPRASRGVAGARPATRSLRAPPGDQYRARLTSADVQHERPRLANRGCTALTCGYVGSTVDVRVTTCGRSPDYLRTEADGTIAITKRRCRSSCGAPASGGPSEMRAVANKAPRGANRRGAVPNGTARCPDSYTGLHS